MCRHIKPLFNFEPPATEVEIHNAALQFVRKLSGTQKPSKVNEVAFNQAVEEITRSVDRLLASMTTSAPPKDRETERRKVQSRNAARFPTKGSFKFEQGK